ncbi:DUF4345 domain-containing protein [Nocardia transvalensis]|uniref:DUF4345 domain-containing protein n=1 Tax=Nocardia transvalensis TaxID=37333 RepID=UPI0018955490|nr:DUF4345 domain-containing protein [Nocardia transvalensis]MBF6327879.1 DUF4345 domain-containing protein [Nocardia transvalensis]
MRTAVRWILIVFGIGCSVIALSHIFIGPQTIPGANTPNPSLDGDIRMIMVLFFAYGAACVWAARDLNKYAGLIHFLMLLFFVGGLVRLMTVAYVGWPNAFFLTMIVFELALPLIVSPLLQRITGRSASSDLAALTR